MMQMMYKNISENVITGKKNPELTEPRSVELCGRWVKMVLVTSQKNLFSVIFRKVNH